MNTRPDFPTHKKSFVPQEVKNEDIPFLKSVSRKPGSELTSVFCLFEQRGPCRSQWIKQVDEIQEVLTWRQDTGEEATLKINYISTCFLRLCIAVKKQKPDLKTFALNSSLVGLYVIQCALGQYSNDLMTSGERCPPWEEKGNICGKITTGKREPFLKWTYPNKSDSFLDFFQHASVYFLALSSVQQALWLPPPPW